MSTGQVKHILNTYYKVKYIEKKDRQFTTEGGIRERMTAARLEQRQTQKQIIAQQAREIEQLKAEVARLRALLAKGDSLG